MNQCLVQALVLNVQATCVKWMDLHDNETERAAQH
eukprot:COSAG03_NODE_30987_length_153_cov_16.444444_1_plen_34_part_01